MSPEEFTLPIYEKARILRKNIGGVDIDPQAVEITMMSLYLKALEGERGLLPKKQHLLPPLSNNIKCGNSLIGYDIFDSSIFSSLRAKGEAISKSEIPRSIRPRNDKQRARDEHLEVFDDETKSRINPFDWNSKSVGFGEIMENGGFDVVIGNPPYGYMISPEQQGYFSMTYKHQDYQKDFYLLFLERYHQIMKKGSLLGVIVSNTWLQSVTLRKIRQYLTSNYRWLRILQLPEKIFKAVVDTHVLIFQKEAAGILNKDIISIDIRKADQILFRHNLSGKYIPHNGDVINISASQEAQGLFQRIQNSSTLLKDICKVYNGAKPFEKGKGTPPQTEKTMREKPFVKEGAAPDKSWSPLLRGSLIHRYENLWNQDYWIKYGPWLAASRDPSIFQSPLKIVVRQTGDAIISTLVEAGFIARDNLHIVLPKDTRYSLYYVLGLMNSHLMDFIYTFINPEKGEALAQIKKKHVEQLPIRTIDFNNPSEKAIHDKLVSLVDRMLELHKKKNSRSPSAERDKIEREIAVTDEKIDEIVYGLYGITDEEIKTIEESSK